ncbi:TetR/AcrR family transcriptional regulator [Parasphingorhabdus cellanae]|uniref:TetR/AcrR family transcriptional regulator n=1 Tax=Parasphingorhabdus cellanae TaxID=2806553 RepID=A0ABX7T0D8_9SPHN|nr:TetR/AcrR family transcriptional regulator [Parasphingorhabdus cellanae]QTD55014.1 TetR/AcrR family transcriptional regulator [Parasphingorhabdus cellanae]
MKDAEVNQLHRLADRPASQRKIADILTAARVEFFANGFSAATIEAIAARAQVSKVTVYSWFKDKENLFGQVVQTEVAHMRENFMPENLAEKSLRDILLYAALGMLDFLLREDRVRLERILAAEMTRDPAIGKMFLKNGPLRMAEGLKALLRASVEKGEIHSDDLEASAEMFAGLVMGRMDLLLRYGHKIKMTTADKEKRAKRAVDAWMLIHQP